MSLTIIQIKVTWVRQIIAVTTKSHFLFKERRKTRKILFERDQLPRVTELQHSEMKIKINDN